MTQEFSLLDLVREQRRRAEALSDSIEYELHGDYLGERLVVRAPALRSVLMGIAAVLRINVTDAGDEPKVDTVTILPFVSTASPESPSMLYAQYEAVVWFAPDQAIRAMPRTKDLRAQGGENDAAESES